MTAGTETDSWGQRKMEPQTKNAKTRSTAEDYWVWWWRFIISDSVYLWRFWCYMTSIH